MTWLTPVRIFMPLRLNDGVTSAVCTSWVKVFSYTNTRITLAGILWQLGILSGPTEKVWAETGGAVPQKLYAFLYNSTGEMFALEAFIVERAKFRPHCHPGKKPSCMSWELPEENTWLWDTCDRIMRFQPSGWPKRWCHAAPLPPLAFLKLSFL